ncbi:unnamed protein product [Ectocarpus sp. 4 AP-2014]
MMSAKKQVCIGGSASKGKCVHIFSQACPGKLREYLEDHIVVFCCCSLFRLLLLYSVLLHAFCHIQAYQACPHRRLVLYLVVQTWKLVNKKLPCYPHSRKSAFVFRKRARLLTVFLIDPTRPCFR